MKTVVHFTGPLGVGGIERWLERIVPLCPVNIKSVLAVNRLGGKLEPAFAKFGAEVRCLGRFSSPLSYMYNAFSLVIAHKRAEGECIAHIHTMEFGWMAMVAAKLAGADLIVLHSHNDQVPHKRLSLGRVSLVLSWLATLLCRPVAAGCSLSAREVLFPLHPAREYSPIPYCLPGRFLEELVALPIAKGCDYPKIHICNVGRLAPQKNHLFLLDVIDAALKRGINVTLTIFGEGRLRSELEQQARAKGVADNVSFAGVSHQVLAELRRDADVFVFPSNWEGFPVALIEAQAVGIPIVCSDRISTECFMAPDVVALPIGLSSVEAWVDAILRLAPLSPRRTARPVNISIAERFSPLASWNRLATLYASGNDFTII